LFYYRSLAFLWTSLLANGVERAFQIVALAAVARSTIVASDFAPSAGITRQLGDGTAACHLPSRDTGRGGGCLTELAKTSSRTDASVKWFERSILSPLSCQVPNHTGYIFEVQTMLARSLGDDEKDA
jgi:hypothetical protein